MKELKTRFEIKNPTSQLTKMTNHHRSHKVKSLLLTLLLALLFILFYLRFIDGSVISRYVNVAR